MGSLLTKGNNPNEFIQAPWVSSATFFNERDELHAGIYDFQRGRVFNANITQTLKTGKLDMHLMRDSLPPFLFNFFIIDSARYFCKEANHQQIQQTRYLIERDKQLHPAVFDSLNCVKLEEMQDINILSTITKFNPARNIVVEMPVGLNYLNMYSLDGTFTRTLCIGDKVDNIKDIQNKKIGFLSIAPTIFSATIVSGLVIRFGEIHCLRASLVVDALLCLFTFILLSCRSIILLLLYCLLFGIVRPLIDNCINSLVIDLASERHLERSNGMISAQ